MTYYNQFFLFHQVMHHVQGDLGLREIVVFTLEKDGKELGTASPIFSSLHP